MVDPLHDLIVEAIVDKIAMLDRAGVKQIDFRMTHDFYSRWIAWALDKPRFTSWKGEFMGARICVDDWSYEWSVVPRPDYD